MGLQMAAWISTGHIWVLRMALYTWVDAGLPTPSEAVISAQGPLAIAEAVNVC